MSEDDYSDEDFGGNCISVAMSADASTMDDSPSIENVILGRRNRLPSDASASTSQAGKSSSFSPHTRVGTPGLAVGNGRRHSLNNNTTNNKATRQDSPDSDSGSVDEERGDAVQTLVFKTATATTFTIKTFRDIRGASFSRSSYEGSCVLLGVGLDGLGSPYAVAKFPIADDDVARFSATGGVSAAGHLAPTVVRSLRQRMQAICKIPKSRNILPHYGAMLHKGALYSAAHYAFGGSIADIAARRRNTAPYVRLPEDFIKQVVRGVLQGLAKVFEFGFVHGGITVHSVYFDTAIARHAADNDEDEAESSLLTMLGGFTTYLVSHRPTQSSVVIDDSDATPHWATKVGDGRQGPKRSPARTPREKELPSAFLTGALGPKGNEGLTSPLNHSNLGNSFGSAYDEDDSARVSLLASALADDLRSVHTLAMVMLQGFNQDGPIDRCSVSTDSDIVPSSTLSPEGVKFFAQILLVADDVAALTAASMLGRRHGSLGIIPNANDVAKNVFATASSKITSQLLGTPYMLRKMKNVRHKSDGNLVEDPQREIECFVQTQRKAIAVECASQRSGEAGAGRMSFRLGSASNITQARVTRVARSNPLQDNRGWSELPKMPTQVPVVKPVMDKRDSGGPLTGRVVNKSAVQGLPAVSTSRRGFMQQL